MEGTGFSNISEDNIHYSQRPKRALNPLFTYRQEQIGVLEKKLLGMGMTKPEARMYVTLLSLGKGKLIDLARLAHMSHATAHYCLKVLQGRGMVSKGLEGKQKYYLIHHPRQGLWSYIDKIRKEAEQKERLVRDALEGFELKYAELDGRPEMKFIDGAGDDVSRRIELEIAGTKFKEVFEFFDMEESVKNIPKKLKKEINHEFKIYRRKTYSIYASEKGAILPGKHKRQLYYYVPKKEFAFPGSLLVLDNKVILISYHPRKLAVVINDSSISQVLKSLFRLGLKGAATYRENKKLKKYASSPASNIKNSLQP